MYISHLFGCGKANFGTMSRGQLHHLGFITALLLLSTAGHMELHITDWFSKPS